MQTLQEYKYAEQEATIPVSQKKIIDGKSNSLAS